MIFRLSLILSLLGSSAFAETMVASRTIRAQSILGAADVTQIERTIPGMLSAPDQVIGLETRVALYAGRPIHPEDVGQPAVIDRNQIVTIVFQRAGLTIAADGRALDRAGIGDRVRVMNLSSRSTVTGLVLGDGSVRVGGPDLSAFD